MVGSACHDEDHLAFAHVAVENLSFGVYEVALDFHLMGDGFAHGALDDFWFHAEAAEIVLAAVGDGLLVDEGDYGGVEVDAVAAFGVDG